MELVRPVTDVFLQYIGTKWHDHVFKFRGEWLMEELSNK
jgi:hypothetical protein